MTSKEDEGLRAVFVGRCEPRKGLHYALEAWIESGAAERGTFTICGNFYPGYREVLEPMLRHPSVTVQGWVDDPGKLMRESDVFLLPSVEEGSAFVTYEAQASGCALVVSDATGARCEHMQQGLVHEAGDLPHARRAPAPRGRRPGASLPPPRERGRLAAEPDVGVLGARDRRPLP